MKHILRFALFALPAIIAMVFVVGMHSEQLFAQGNEDLNASADGDGMLAPVDGGVTSVGGGVASDGGGVRSTGGSTQLKNPLKSQSIEEFILKIIDVLLVFALPIIVLYIMYAGYLFVTAQGDSGQVSTARSALLWAVVGGVIVLGARVIVAVIQGTITAF